MLAEILLVLSGHSSSFFVPTTSQNGSSTLTVSPRLSEFLHPGEVASLNDLGLVAHQYRKIRDWATSTQQRGREAVLASSLTVKGKARAEEPSDDAPDQYLSTLASGVLDVLQAYEMLIVELEAKILQLDPAIVQDADGYVPLTTLTAALSPWRAPLASLVALVDRLASPPAGTPRCTPGALIQLVEVNTHTGNPHLAQIYATLLAGLRHLFLTHLVTFLLFGIAPTSSSPTLPAIALDIGSDPLSPKHRQYRLNDGLLPAAVSARTRESILYVGRVAATLQRETRRLPQTTVSELREAIMSSQDLQEGGDLDLAIDRARKEVGEWLWRHVLTGPHVANALESFGEYLLTRDGEFSTNLIREVSRLRLQKLITSNPHSSSSVIREQDLSLAILRAATGTSAENDRQLEKLRFRLPRGPLRPIMPALTASTRGTPRLGTDDNQYTSGQAVRDLFSSFLLGAPLELETIVAWPLDLFMTPASVSAYGDINAYLLALRETHLQVLDCWTSLSAAQRQRRKWTGANEGGTAEEIGARQSLARTAWGAVRAMLFFLDQLQSHFMVDIIAVQHKRLLAELDGVNVRQSESEAGSLRGSTATRPQSPSGTNRPTPTLYASSVVGGRPASPVSTHGWDTQTARSRAPPTPGRPQASYLDFLTLRQMHTRHLAFLKEGLLISDRTSAALVRDILLTCKRFTGLVERWGGDVLPELLFDTSVPSGKGDLVQERAAAVDEVVETLREHMVDFFRLLVESQNPSLAGGTSSNGTATRTASRAALLQASRVFARQTSFIGVSKGKIAPGGAGVVGSKDKAKAAKEERDLEAEALMGRHIEQLLLRLDFNGVLTGWLAKEDEGGQTQHLLAEGGLSPLPQPV